MPTLEEYINRIKNIKSNKLSLLIIVVLLVLATIYAINQLSLLDLLNKSKTVENASVILDKVNEKEIIVSKTLSNVKYKEVDTYTAEILVENKRTTAVEAKSIVYSDGINPDVNLIENNIFQIMQIF